MAVRIPADHHHGRDLVKDGQRHADPHHSVEQQRRQVGAEPEQQVVAPADCRHAQQTPQQGVLQADIAVQIELFIGVVPPAAVVDPFQQLGGQPLHHRGIDHAAEKQCRQAGALVVQTDGDEHSCRAVHKAEGAGGHAAVGEPAALCGCNNGLAYPAQKGIYQINYTKSIEIQVHSAPFPEQKGAGKRHSRPSLFRLRITAGSYTVPRSPPRWYRGGCRGGRHLQKQTRPGSGCPLPSGCPAGLRGCPHLRSAA